MPPKTNAWKVLEIFLLDLGGVCDVFEKVPASATADIMPMNSNLGEEWVTSQLSPTFFNSV